MFFCGGFLWAHFLGGCFFRVFLWGFFVVNELCHYFVGG